MDANEAWEQFKKAVAEERHGPSVSEKLDVLSAQALQTSTQLDEMEKKLDEIAAPTGDEQGVEMPIPGQEIAAMGGGMPGGMAGGMPAAGAPPDAMAQMMGGAEQGGQEEPQQPPRGAAPTGSQVPGASFQASASKKVLRSRSSIAKISCEKGAIGMAGGKEKIAALVDEVENLAGSNDQVVELLHKLKGIVLGNAPENSETFSKTKINKKFGGGRGKGANNNKKNGYDSNNPNSVVPASKTEGRVTRDLILGYTPDLKTYPYTGTNEQKLNWIRSAAKMSQGFLEDPDILDTNIPDVLKSYGLTDENNGSWADQFEKLRGQFKKWDYSNKGTNIYSVDPKTGKLVVTPHDGLADSEMRALANILNGPLKRLYKNNVESKKIFTPAEAEVLGQLHKDGFGPKIYRALVGRGRGGNDSFARVLENLLLVAPAVDIMGRLPKDHIESKKDPRDENEKDVVNAKIDDIKAIAKDLNALDEKQAESENKTEFKIAPYLYGEGSSKDNLDHLSDWLEIELGPTAWADIRDEYMEKTKTKSDDAPSSLVSLIRTLNGQRSSNTLKRDVKEAASSKYNTLEKIIERKLKEWTGFKARYEELSDESKARLIEDLTPEDRATYSKLSDGTAKQRFIYNRFGKLMERSDKALQMINAYTDRTTTGNQRVREGSPTNIPLVFSVLFKKDGTGTFQDLVDRAKQSALAYAQKRYDEFIRKRALNDYHRTLDNALNAGKSPEDAEKEAMESLKGFKAKDFFDIDGIFNNKALHNLPSREEYYDLPEQYRAEVTKALKWRGLTPDQLWTNDHKLLHSMDKHARPDVKENTGNRDLWLSEYSNIPVSEQKPRLRKVLDKVLNKLDKYTLTVMRGDFHNFDTFQQVFEDEASKVAGYPIHVPTPLYFPENWSKMNSSLKDAFVYCNQAALNDLIMRLDTVSGPSNPHTSDLSNAYPPGYPNMIKYILENVPIPNEYWVVSTGSGPNDRLTLPRYLYEVAHNEGPRSETLSTYMKNLRTNKKDKADIEKILEEYTERYRQHLQRGSTVESADARAFKSILDDLNKYSFDMDDWESGMCEDRYKHMARDRNWINELRKMPSDAEDKGKISKILVSKFIGNLAIMHKMGHGGTKPTSDDPETYTEDVTNVLGELEDLSYKIWNDQEKYMTDRIKSVAKSVYDCVAGKDETALGDGANFATQALKELIAAPKTDKSDEKTIRDGEKQVDKEYLDKDFYVMDPNMRAVGIRPFIEEVLTPEEDDEEPHTGIFDEKYTGKQHSVSPRSTAANWGIFDEKDAGKQHTQKDNAKEKIVSEVLIRLYPAAFGIDKDTLVKTYEDLVKANGEYGPEQYKKYLIDQNDLLMKTASVLGRDDEKFERFNKIHSLLEKQPDKVSMDELKKEGAYTIINTMPDEFKVFGIQRYSTAEEKEDNPFIPTAKLENLIPKNNTVTGVKPKGSTGGNTSTKRGANKKTHITCDLENNTVTVVKPKGSTGGNTSSGTDIQEQIDMSNTANVGDVQQESDAGLQALFGMSDADMQRMLSADYQQEGPTPPEDDGKTASDKSTPGKTASNKSTPGKTASDKSTPGKTASDKSTPGKTASDKSTPGKTASDKSEDALITKSFKDLLSEKRGTVRLGNGVLLK